MNSSNDKAASNSFTWRDGVDNPWIVLGLLFFVTGFLGIPLLWMSKGFSTLMKIVLSVVVTVYTFALFGCVGLVLWWAYQQIANVG